MSDPTLLAARLDSGLSERRPEEPVAEAVCRLCVEILGADGGYIAVGDGPEPDGPVYATDERATRIADLELALGEGPAHTTLDEGRGLAGDTTAGLAVDLATVSARWPLFLPAAISAVGQVRVHVLPLVHRHRRLGVLTTYYSEGAGPRADRPSARALADRAGEALVAQDDGGAGDVVADEAHEARAAVDRATGMVVGQLGIPASAALAVLRARAFADDETVLAVAREVLARRLVFDDRHPRGSR
ncbi:GAF domain-containing protein [Cellulomonas sp. PhB143]|uniref:GAF domain-containing protein n=1 Tax=Cellulomonas sp. PhB143 TaxID=2485186 RepID=UPI000F493DA9|nr:GAF domain-containing protein [Cellulomonas sp. PhB143]ROS73299.1 hypothetical protein EDF32_2566 [Cellulomonas sp. PhB143]